jgi:hypothetical protein
MSKDKTKRDEGLKILGAFKKQLIMKKTEERGGNANGKAMIFEK